MQQHEVVKFLKNSYALVANICNEIKKTSEKILKNYGETN